MINLMTENCLYALMHIVLWYHESRFMLIEFSFKIDLFYVIIIIILNRNELSFILDYLETFYGSIKCKTHLRKLEEVKKVKKEGW